VSLENESKPRAVTRPDLLASLREESEVADRSRHDVQEELTARLRLVCTGKELSACVDLIREHALSAWGAGREALWVDLVENGMIVVEGEPGDIVYFGLNARDRYAEVDA
jgi:hypothetical protein